MVVILCKRHNSDEKNIDELHILEEEAMDSWWWCSLVDISTAVAVFVMPKASHSRLHRSYVNHSVEA